MSSPYLMVVPCGNWKEFTNASHKTGPHTTVYQTSIAVVAYQIFYCHQVTWWYHQARLTRRLYIQHPSCKQISCFEGLVLIFSELCINERLNHFVDVPQQSPMLIVSRGDSWLVFGSGVVSARLCSDGNLHYCSVIFTIIVMGKHKSSAHALVIHGG